MKVRMKLTRLHSTLVSDVKLLIAFVSVISIGTGMCSLISKISSKIGQITTALKCAQ